MLAFCGLPYKISAGLLADRHFQVSIETGIFRPPRQTGPPTGWPVGHVTSSCRHSQRSGARPHPRPPTHPPSSAPADRGQGHPQVQREGRSAVPMPTRRDQAAKGGRPGCPKSRDSVRCGRAACKHAQNTRVGVIRGPGRPGHPGQLGRRKRDPTRYISSHGPLGVLPAEGGQSTVGAPVRRARGGPAPPTGPGDPPPPGSHRAPPTGTWCGTEAPKRATIT